MASFLIVSKRWVGILNLAVTAVKFMLRLNCEGMIVSKNTAWFMLQRSY